MCWYGPTIEYSVDSYARSIPALLGHKLFRQPTWAGGKYVEDELNITLSYICHIIVYYLIFCK